MASLIERNPFELSVEEQLKRFKKANVQECWLFGDDEFARLAETAPSWPDGRLAVRSLRIRRGWDQKGVESTFEAHVRRIESVFGSGGFERWEGLRSNKEHLRLLSGDDTHEPGAEWVVIDLATNWPCKSIAAIRGKNSCTDELLVVAWMFPDLVRAIDFANVPGFLAAGYELSVPIVDGAAKGVPLVDFSPESLQVRLRAGWLGDEVPQYSVPVLRE